MRIIDWTGEYNIDANWIYGDLYEQEMLDAPMLDSLGYEILYDLVACVETYPGKITTPTSVIVASGLTKSEADLEISLTNRRARFPDETIDYTVLQFTGQKSFEMKPGRGPWIPMFDGIRDPHLKGFRPVEREMQFMTTFR